jgi:hypothetical protein
VVINLTSLYCRDRLIEQPYAPLTQQYQTCRNDPTTAFLNQAGVSAGNVSLLSPFGVLLVLALLGAYQFCTGAVIPRAYSRQEKDAALDALAVALLLVRDRRLGHPVHSSSAGGDSSEAGAGDEVAKSGQSGAAGKLVSGPGSEGEGTARRAAVLADVVEALAEAAAAAERDPSLNWQRGSTEEPVHVDWGRLRAKVLGRATGAGAGKATMRDGSSVTTSRNGSDDDVELATVSGIHAATVTAGTPKSTKGTK